MASVSDPLNPGWVRGYAVLSYPDQPWSLLGVFGTRQEAEAKRMQAGPTYRVVFGSHESGTDDFIEGMSEQRSDP